MLKSDGKNIYLRETEKITKEDRKNISPEEVEKISLYLIEIERISFYLIYLSIRERERERETHLQRHTDHGGKYTFLQLCEKTYSSLPA